MTQEDIIALAHAGFSRSEILAMIQPQQDPQPDPQPAPADPQPQQEPQPDPQPQQEPQPQQAQEPAPTPQQPSNQDVLAAINSLTAAIQNINRNSAQQPGQNRLTGDDVMAGFIRPPKPETK